MATTSTMKDPQSRHDDVPDHQCHSGCSCLIPPMPEATGRTMAVPATPADGGQLQILMCAPDHSGLERPPGAGRQSRVAWHLQAATRPSPALGPPPIPPPPPPTPTTPHHPHECHDRRHIVLNVLKNGCASVTEEVSCWNVTQMRQKWGRCIALVVEWMHNGRPVVDTKNIWSVTNPIPHPGRWFCLGPFCLLHASTGQSIVCFKRWLWRPLKPH